MEYYDTIIIGAGLAGCALGQMLLKQKKKVMIIESKDLKQKNKLCGGIITPKAYKTLFKIYGNDLNQLSFEEHSTFKVKNNEVEKIIKNHKLYTIYRKDLDDFVCRKFLNNGGLILDNTTYEKIDFKQSIIYVFGKAYKYNNLVGADGVFSKVRYDLIGKNQKMNFAIESEISKKSNIIQIDFIEEFKGYAWTIPNNKNNIIGLGDVSQNKDIESAFENHFKLDNNIRGAFIPAGGDILLKKGNVFLIGDAAGLASPATGEGMHFAISSAFNLAKTMNSFYHVRLIKDRIIILIHRLSKLLIYNTNIRNFFYKLYGKSKIITFLLNLILKLFL